MTFVHHLGHIDKRTDKELFSLVSQGSEQAFRLIFDRYQRRMWLFVVTLVKSSYVAEEIIQESFIKLWNYRDLLANVKKPDDFIFILIRNHALNYLRTLVGEQKGKNRLWEAIKQQSAYYDYSLEAKETEQVIAQIIECLPAQQRNIFHLSRDRALSHQEIADQLNLSKNTVKNHLVAAFKSIRVQLKRAGFLSIFFLAH